MEEVFVLLIESPNPCPVCGKLFLTERKKLNRGQKCCSHRCGIAYRNLNSVKRGRKTKSLITCLNCGNEFIGRLRTDGKQKIYCSHRCMQEHRGIVAPCAHCGREFVSYDRYAYCSRKCQHASVAVPPIAYICPLCGVSFERDACQDLRKDSDPNRIRFCSMKCAGLARRGEGHPLFRGGTKAYRGKTWIESKKRMREMFLYCRFCEEFVDGQERHVDHIVPYRIAKLGKMDPNGERNLWVLCRGCHAKKTHIEPKLFKFGRQRYIEELLKIANRDDVISQINDAFKYCGITDVKSMTVVTLARGSGRKKNKDLIGGLFSDSKGETKLQFA